MIKLPTTTAYSTKEAAEMLDKKPRDVWAYIKSGKLRAQKVGRSWYITEKTLTEFVTGEKIDSTTSSSVVSNNGKEV